MKKINTFTTIGLGKVGKIFTDIFNKDFNIKIDNLIDKYQKGDFLGKKILNDIPSDIDSDLILFALPDDLIKNTMKLLFPRVKKNTIFLHFSGALYIKGDNIVSLHPMMSIINYEYSSKHLKEHYFTIQSDNDELLSFFYDLLKIKFPNLLKIKGDDKKYFHLSSVIINNFSTMLVKLSVDILKNLNISENKALDYLMPLFKDAYMNISETKDINKSLTGPIVRKDYKTIELHKNLLETNIIEGKNIYDSFLNFIENSKN